MNFRLTAILLAIVVVLGCVIAIVATRPKTEEKKSAVTNPVIEPTPKAVTAITMKRDGATVVAFAKANDKWNLTEPLKAPTESWTVDPIADALKDLSYKDKFAPEASGRHSLTTLGLAEPKTTVTFTDDAGKSYTLLVGKRSPAKTVYTRLASDTSNTVYEVDAGWYEKLDKDPTDFRSKDVTSIEPAQVKAVGIAHPAENVKPIEVVKADNKWVIQKPIPTRAAQQTIEDVLTAVRGLRAESFSTITRDNPAAGLTTPVLTVTVMQDDKAGKPVGTAPATTQGAKLTATTIDFGNPTDLSKKSVYASLADSKEVIVVSMDAFKKLDKQLKDLRATAITPAPVTEATAIEIGTPATTQPAVPAKLALTKTDGNWAINGPTKIPAEDAEVASFLDALKALHANKFVDGAGDLKSIGLDPPTRTITLTLPGQAQRETILIGKPQTAEPLTPVMRQGETTVYLVLNADMAKLQPTLLTLRQREIEKPVADHIRTIDIAPKTGPKRTLQRQGTSWKVNGKAADDAKAANLLGDFTPLTADKWLATKPLTGPADITVTVTMLETPAPTTSTAPATASAPALPTTSIGPVAAKTITRTLLLKKDKDSWQATWSPMSEPWTFAPAAALIEHLTKTTYEVPPKATTAPATATAPAH